MRRNKEEIKSEILRRRDEYKYRQKKFWKTMAVSVCCGIVTLALVYALVTSPTVRRWSQYADVIAINGGAAGTAAPQGGSDVPEGAKAGDLWGGYDEFAFAGQNTVLPQADGAAVIAGESTVSFTEERNAEAVARLSELVAQLSLSGGATYGGDALDGSADDTEFTVLLIFGNRLLSAAKTGDGEYLVNGRLLCTLGTEADAELEALVRAIAGGS